MRNKGSAAVGSIGTRLAEEVTNAVITALNCGEESVSVGIEEVESRDWAEKEASGVFRTLVKEGTAVESRAIRLVGDQVESSVTKANVVLKRTRATIETVVRAYTDTAVGIVRQSIPRLAQGPASSAKVSARRPAKAAKQARKSVQRGKRAAKATSKR